MNSLLVKNYNDKECTIFTNHSFEITVDLSVCLFEFICMYSTVCKHQCLIVFF